MEATDAGIKFYLDNGYVLCNYRPGRIAVHFPNGGGLCRYIHGELADKLGEQFDPWNFGVAQRLAAENRTGDA